MSDIHQFITRKNLRPTTSITLDTANLISSPYYQKIFPNEASPFGGEASRVATFDLSSPNCMIDLSETTLQGHIKLNLGTTFTLDGSAHSLFSQVRLMQDNGNVWEEVPNYNELVAAELVIENGADRLNNRWEELCDQAVVDDGTKTLIDSSAGIKFVIKPRLNFSKQQKVAHLPICKNLRLEFTFDQTVNAGKCGTGATIDVISLELNAKMYPMSPRYITELKELARAGKLLYNFEGCYAQTAPWANANNSVSINYPVASANKLLGRFYLSDDVNKFDKHGIQKSNYLTGLSAVQVQHASDYYPRQAINTPELAHHYLQDAYDVDDNKHCESVITRTNYQCADGNAEIAAIPLFYVGLKLRSGDSINTGLSLNHAPLVFRTQNTAISTLYLRLFMFHAVSVQVFENQCIINV